MDGTVLYVLLASGMALVALMSPYAGLLAYLGILYLRPQEHVIGLAEMNPTRTAAILLLVAVGLWVARGDIRPRFQREMRPFLAFLGAILASSVVGYWVTSLDVFWDMIKNLVAFWLIITLVNTQSRLRWLIWSVLAFQGIMAADTISAYIHLADTDPTRVRLGSFTGGYFGGAGDFAVMTNILIPYALVFVLGEQGWIKKALALACLGVLIGGVVVSLARGGGVIAMITALGAGTLLSTSRWRGTRWPAVLILAGVVAGIFVLAPQQFFLRSESVAHFASEDTAEDRIEFWKAGFRMFAASPILGVGAGLFSENLRILGYGQHSAHNMFVDVMGQLGLAGILSFGWLVTWVLKGLWLARSSLDPTDPRDRFLYAVCSGTLASLLTYFIGGLFQSILYYPMLYIHMAIAVAANQVVNQRHRRSESDHEPGSDIGRREVAWSR